MIRPHKQSRKRRGSTYLLVLFTSLIVSAIGMAAFTALRTKDQVATLERDWHDSALLAVSATELGLAHLSNYYFWRDAYEDNQNGNFSEEASFGRGTVRWQLEDPVDGDITDSPADPVRIYGWGRVGNSQRVFSLLAWPCGSTLDVLRTAVHADKALTVAGSLDVRDGPASCNDDFRCDGAQVIGDVESPKIDKPQNIIGSADESAVAKTMPVRMLHSVYKSFATEIPFSGGLLNLGGGLRNCVISPRHNPSDPDRTNANGLYWTRVPALTGLTVRDCRIEGTLLIELSGLSSLTIGPNVVWKPYRPDFPALIVYTASDASTNVTIECSGQLSESAAGVNFNPATAPYYGIDDSDTTDTYNASIRGLIHVIRDVSGTPNSLTTISAPRKITGCIVADGRVRITGDSILVADPDLYSKPPLGYTAYPNPDNLLVNGGMESGLASWTAVGSQTRLKPSTQAHSGNSSILVENRQSAADGIRQDITGRVGEGMRITSDVWVRMSASPEDVTIALEIEGSDSGAQRFETTASVGTDWTRVRAVHTATWLGSLEHARWSVTTTTSNQDFRIDDASIADPSEDLPVNLMAIPGTWRAEAIP